MNAIVFTLKGDFARFRVPYTTTSALTYSLIHPIAVRGVVGAVMGIEYNELYSYTKDMNIGIQVLNPIKKDTQSFNLVPQTGSNGAANFQSRVEFLRDVKYRIFLSTSDDLLYKIKNIMENREFQFTPYLGASEHVTKIDFEGMYNCEVAECTEYSDTVIYKSSLGKLSENEEIHLDRIPVENSATREYKRYEKVAFVIASRIKAQNATIYNIGGFNVNFL